jgi:hypothetical protein
VIATFQGTAQAFQDSLSTLPLLILAAIVAVYIILGVLCESYIHPITILSTLPSAGLGALLTLKAGGFELSLIAIIGIILLIGIVKKNAIMMIDFALVAEREHGLKPAEAIYQACLLRFRPIMMTNHGGIAWRAAADARHRHRLGNPPAARVCHCGRTRRQSVSDALHDTDSLPLSRPSARLAARRPRQGAVARTGVADESGMKRDRAAGLRCGAQRRL